MAARLATFRPTMSSDVEEFCLKSSEVRRSFFLFSKPAIRLCRPMTTAGRDGILDSARCSAPQPGVPSSAALTCSHWPRPRSMHNRQSWQPDADRPAPLDYGPSTFLGHV